MKDVLLRQRSELQLQIDNLQGAMELCSLMLQEKQMDDAKLKWYLNYVHEKEEEGKKFAEVEELLEDIVEYTKSNVFGCNPEIALLFQKPWIARTISIVFWALAIVVPASYLVSVFMGREQLKIMFISVYALIVTVYGAGFLKYHKERKKYLAERGKR